MPISDKIFQKYAIRKEYLTEELLEKCKILQREPGIYHNKPLSEIAVDLHWLNPSQLDAIIAKAKQKLIFGGYRICKILGEGGLAMVYLAEQLRMKRYVALKVLYARWMEDSEFRRRFVLEARIVGTLSHPNLIQVYDMGYDQRRYFFSMEYVHGDTVEQIIQRDKRIPLKESLNICSQMLEALQYIWSKNLVHRDIKPSNIIINENNVAKLSDFGFVKTKLEGKFYSNDSTIGTPDYMSPEQAMGKIDLDYRSDIYSLGATLYHMCTGEVPFNGTESNVIQQHLDAQIVSPCSLVPELPNGFAVIIEKMMAKDPQDRYQSYQELKRDFDLLLNDQSPQQEPLEAGRSRVARCDDYLGKYAQTIVSSLKQKIKQLQHREYFYQIIITILSILLILMLIVK